MKKALIVLLTISVVLPAFFTGCLNFNTATDTKDEIDTDGDGEADTVDSFPNDPNEWSDLDGDGVGDNADAFPNDAFDWIDSDNDGKGDNSDTFPNNPNEWSDLDGDGVGDNADKNPNVNLSIELTIEKFVVTDRVDLLRWAQVYFEIYINGNFEKKVDNYGKNWKVFLNNEEEIYYNFYYDIPDATADQCTTLSIVMKDYDFLKIDKDDVIDVNNEISEKNLIIILDHEKNSITSEEIKEGNQGKIWYTVDIPKEIDPSTKIFSRTYSWEYNNKNWKITADIPIRTYNKYKKLEVNRMPQGISNNAMSAYVTYNDEVIEKFALKLETLTNSEGFSSLETANFILRFVQSGIDYESDDVTKGREEYWRFPVETLVDMKGDCEDSAVLFSAIMKSLGYDVVLLFYVLDDETGHLAVGINLDENLGSYVKYDGNKYYFCETTNIGNKVGSKPSDIAIYPKEVIDIE